MEIQWGEFYFQADGTVAILLAFAPVAVALAIPKVAGAIKTIVYLVGRHAKAKRVLSLQERADREEQR